MSKKVLVVDDNVDLAEIFTAMLAEEGYETRSALSGTEALDTLSEYPADCLVIDVNLPDLNGDKVVDLVRRDNAHPGIKIVLMSADPSICDTAKDQADLLLIKPITFSQMRTAVSSLLRADD